LQKKSALTKTLFFAIFLNKKFVVIISFFALI